MALTVTAIRVRQNDETFYEAVLDAEQLINEDQFKTDRWNMQSKEGYQREINSPHAKRLANYLKGENTQTNALPSNIVVNFRKPLEIKELANGVCQLIIHTGNVGYIIDGQHRIEGVREDIKEDVDLSDYQFPVTFMQAPLSLEMIHFRNLNSTANRPPKGLSQVISTQLESKYGVVPTTWTGQAINRAINITLRLGTDPASPWNGLLALGGIKKRSSHTLAQSVLVRAMQFMFINGRFSDPDEDMDHIYKLILSFWDACAEVWPEAMNNPEGSMIQRNLGAVVLTRIMNRTFNSIERNPSKEDFAKILWSIATTLKVDDDSWAPTHQSHLNRMRAGYAEAKSYTIISDFLWSGVGVGLKEEANKE